MAPRKQTPSSLPEVRVLVVFGVLFAAVLAQVIPTEVNLVASFSQTGGFGNPNEYEWQSAARIAIEHVNANTTILPNTTLFLNYTDDQTQQKVGMSVFLAGLALNPVGIVGAASSKVCTVISFAGTFYEIPQISYACTSVALSNKVTHPYFLRVVPPDNGQSKAIADLMEYFGWTTVAGISTADEYGVTGIQAFQDAVDQTTTIKLVRVEQFITGSVTILTQVTNLKDSGARVFLSFMVNGDHKNVMKVALDQGIVGDAYVWICPDGCASSASYLEDDGKQNKTVLKAMAGTLGTRPAGGRGPLYEALLEDWAERDPTEYVGAGKSFMHPFAAAAYDVVWTYALVLHDIYTNQPNNQTGRNMLEHLRNISFTGVTGQVFFDQNYDRAPEYEFLNLARGDDLFHSVGTWTVEKGVQIDNSNITWYDGTNTPPDLDIRPPRKYFSCHDGEEKTDPTGKKVKIEKPKAGDVNNIDDDYYCDQYVDCDNLADEYFDCSNSIVPAYITFGILTSLLIIATVILLIIVFFCGCIPWKLRIHRVHASNPFYLLLLLLAAILGYLSTFSFYGKPTVASCGFQPWLVGPAAILLISTLCVRSAYIFWSLRSKYEVIKFSIWKFAIPVVLLNIPFYIVLVLWTIISTPSADYIEVGDRKHYVCISRGFVHDVGIVFFFILYGYLLFLLFCSVIIVFLTRSIKDKYHTGKAVALSVANLFFLAIVIVALFWLKITEQTPLGVFIFTQLAIIYGFGSVLFFHFAPICFGIIKDKIFPKRDEHESTHKVKPAEDD